MSAFLRSFQNAWHGVVAAADGRSFRVQLLAAVWALLLCWIGQAERWKWTAVALVSVLVLGDECMNSAMEQLCDRVTGEQEEPIRRVKDMAAGGVLLCAVGALAVAAAVFGEAGFWKTVWNRILYEGQAWAAFPLLGLPVAALSTALPDYTIEEIEEEDGDH